MKKILIISLLIVFLTGCLPQPGSSQGNDDDLIATLVAATLTAAPDGKYQPLPTQQEQEATGEPPQEPTTQPGDTPLPPSDTPQPTFTTTFTPTFTPTLTPTFTPTVTFTPTLDPGDPVLSLGYPTFDDKFNGTTNFYQYDNSAASYQIETGQMVLTAKDASNYETWSMSWGDMDDFYLEATGSFGPDCSGKDRFGMIFRAPDTSEGYIVTISCDGSYRLSTYESADDDYTVLKGWASSSHLNTGPNASNRLGIWVKDTLLAGYVNGIKVFEVNDSTFSEGRMGVVVASKNTPGFTAYLTRMVYWNLP